MGHFVKIAMTFDKCRDVFCQSRLANHTSKLVGYFTYFELGWIDSFICIMTGFFERYKKSYWETPMYE